MDGARYLKLDDFKDQDDDFLSPKKTLRDFEGGMGTTYVIVYCVTFLHLCCLVKEGSADDSCHRVLSVVYFVRFCCAE